MSRAARCRARWFVYSVPGRLFAFDAETLTILTTAPIARYAKYTPPTIARGKVVLATFDDASFVYTLRWLMVGSSGATNPGA